VEHINLKRAKTRMTYFIKRMMSILVLSMAIIMIIGTCTSAKAQSLMEFPEVPVRIVSTPEWVHMFIHLKPVPAPGNINAIYANVLDCIGMLPDIAPPIEPIRWYRASFALEIYDGKSYELEGMYYVEPPEIVIADAENITATLRHELVHHALGASQTSETSALACEFP